MANQNSTLRSIRSREENLMDRIGSSANQAKDYWLAGQRRTKQLIHQAEANTKRYPLRALGIAAFVGFLIGRFRRFV
jgi:ElaB/YqjD/DUF883 family membrane-anchored ribosome-binding protein